METSLKVKYYKGAYKYQLAEDLVTHLPRYDGGFSIWPNSDIKVPFITLLPDGWLILLTGYASDGPSGPTWDRPSFMRGAFVHDGLYQLMRLRLLDRFIYRPVADKVLANICKEDGMWAWWADNVIENGVQYFAGPYADPSCKRELIIAP
ncbi:MAG: hypothetical protein WC322_06990 [Candidatus Paceibacterota bacterium]|jgi:hypothetical protein